MADDDSKQPGLQPGHQWNAVPFEEVVQKYKEFFQASKEKIDIERVKLLSVEKVPDSEECSDESLQKMAISDGSLMKGGSIFFEQLYGKEKIPRSTLVIILKQLSILGVAYPGLDLDFISGIHDLDSELGTIKLVRGYQELDKIASLLYLCERQKQSQFPVDTESDELAYKQMKEATLKPHHLDFTYTGSRCQYAKTPSNKHECKLLTFNPVVEPTQLSQNGAELAMMTTLGASPSVLGLFAGKGPSAPKERPILERTCLLQNLFAQPAVNPRFSVQTTRLKQILATCTGSLPEFNLLAHGVAVFPYCSKHTRIDIPNREDTGEGEATQGQVTNEVKSSYINAVAKAELYGRPVAENLQSEEVAKLWQKLMGCEIATVLLISPEVNQAIDGLADRFKAMAYMSFLLERLEMEYNGFRSFSDWKKLNWRLRKVYGQVCEGLVVPRTQPNLIYNTMILFQGLSSVRLCFLEGQGRNIAAVHSLLELSGDYYDPKGLPDKPMATLKANPPVDYAIVGATNTKVEVIDLGLQDLTGTTAYDMLSTLGKAIQRRAELVSRVNMTIVMMNYCLKVTVHKATSYASTFKHPELAIPLKERVGGWYTASRFEEFMMCSINEAIRYLNECLIDDDDSPVMRMVDTYLRQVRSGPIKVSSSSQEKTEWFQSKLIPNFKNGFNFKNTNIACPEANVLVTMLSHCFYSLPNHEIASELNQFLQNGGGGTTNYKKTANKTHYFPSPDAGYWKLNGKGGCDFPAEKKFEARFIMARHRPNLSPIDPADDMPFLARLGWLVVQPAKVLGEVIIYTRKVKSPMMALLRSRHFPPAFEDVLSIYNKLGTVLPVSKELARTMPNLFRLLSMNTFSSSHMKEYLEELKDKEDDEPAARSPCMYYDGGNPGDKQVSNVPMMILVLAFLQISSFVPADTERRQDVMEFTSETNYVKMFGTGKQGLEEEDDGVEGINGFCSRYKNNIAIRYPTLPLYDEYSVVEIIRGLLNIPFGQSHYSLSDDERAKVDETLSEFHLERHYYDVLQHPNKVSEDWPDRTKKASKVVLTKQKKKAPSKKPKKAGKKKGKKAKEADDTNPGSSDVSNSAASDIIVLDPDAPAPANAMVALTDTGSGGVYVPLALNDTAHEDPAEFAPPYVSVKELDLEIHQAVNVAVQLTLQRAAFSRAKNEFLYEGRKTHVEPLGAKDDVVMLRETMESVKERLQSVRNAPTEVRAMSDLMFQLAREASYRVPPLDRPNLGRIDGLAIRTHDYVHGRHGRNTESSMFGSFAICCKDTEKNRAIHVKNPPSKFKLYCQYMDKNTSESDNEDSASGELTDGDKKPRATVKKSSASIKETDGLDPNPSASKDAPAPAATRRKPSATKEVVNLSGSSSDDDDKPIATIAKNRQKKDPPHKAKVAAAGNGKGKLAAGVSPAAINAAASSKTSVPPKQPSKSADGKGNSKRQAPTHSTSSRLTRSATKRQKRTRQRRGEESWSPQRKGDIQQGSGSEWSAEG